MFSGQSGLEQRGLERRWTGGARPFVEGRPALPREDPSWCEMPCWPSRSTLSLLQPCPPSRARDQGRTHGTLIFGQGVTTALGGLSSCLCVHACTGPPSSEGVNCFGRSPWESSCGACRHCFVRFSPLPATPSIVQIQSRFHFLNDHLRPRCCGSGGWCAGLVRSLVQVHARETASRCFLLALMFLFLPSSLSKSEKTSSGEG